MTSFLHLVLVVQGSYYLATGVWPLISMRSFITVTGPKYDLWLVQTVGILVAVIGAVLISAGIQGRAAPEIIALAIGSAAGLTLIDVIYSSKNRISKVYLFDAVGEIILLVLLLTALFVR